MSHRKVRSQGYIPFSWEEKPGIPKFISHQKSSSDIGLNTPKIVSHDNIRSSKNKIIPPPPCTYSQPTRKSSSRKAGPWWKDHDPFLAALRSCSKNDDEELRHMMIKGNHESSSKGKNNNHNMIKKSSAADVFSCKHSCNVETDNLVKFSKLPPLPKERYNAKSFVKRSG